MRPVLAAIALSLATPVFADGITAYRTDDTFEDATFALENAVIARGLVIDHVSDVGGMLKRTRADVGGDQTIYDAASVYQFCSAVTSRKMMEADPMNIAYCPYTLFITDRGGAVTIGFRNLPAGTMREVQALLDGIAREAAGQ